MDSADRTAHVLMLGGSERGFAVDCWTGGVCAATGSTPDLAEAAGAMHSWTQGAELRELTAGWTFLRTLDLAEAEERRETETIARRWHFRVQRQASRRDADWRDLAVAAHAQPRLRALSPGRAMYWFTLSRRATPPTCDDLPRTRPLGRHRFEVTYADGRVQVVKGAEAAVAAILEGLPEDITAAAPDA